MGVLLGYITHFCMGLLASFIGSIPFGTVNLSVVDTTISKSFRAGVVMAVAAGLVEILQSFLAFNFGSYISLYLDSNPFVQLFAFALLVLLGLAFFFRKAPGENSSRRGLRLPAFAKGAFLALINPQALPFYILVIAYLQAEQLLAPHMGMSMGLIAAFLLGISAGRFLALLMYGLLSLVIVQRTQSLGLWMNKILGSLFFLLAAVQGARLLLG